jgi:hypothetical protein
VIVSYWMDEVQYAYMHACMPPTPPVVINLSLSVRSLVELLDDSAHADHVCRGSTVHFLHADVDGAVNPLQLAELWGRRLHSASVLSPN